MQDILVCEYVSTQGTQGTLAPEHVSTQGTLAHKHLSMQDTQEYPSKQGTLACEHISMQGTLACEHVRVAIQQTTREHVSTEAHKHARHVCTLALF